VISPVPPEAEEVRGAAVGWLPQLLAGRARAVASLFHRCHEVEAAVDRRGLGPGARSLREPVGRVGVGVAVLGRVDVGEVGGRTEIVDLHEAVARRLADTAAERFVVVVDGDRAAGLLFQPDLEAAEPLSGRGLLGVGSAVRPGVVLEHEDLELARRQRVIRARRSELNRRGEASVRRSVVGQRDVGTPHLVIEGPNGDQVAAFRQVDGAPVLVTHGHDRRVALGAERQRIARQFRVVLVNDEVEVRERVTRREVAGIDGDRTASRRARRGRVGLGGDGRRQR
jgi:hypothetical protein